MDHGRARLGRYELGPVLGEGGAGRVHRAELIGPGGFRRSVALKILHKGGEALRREARIGGLLRHRNLVDVYEIGEVDGQWFCALELCRGSLTEHLPLPPRAVVEVGLQVCAALQYAHAELGLVHLDLKPDNLLIGEDGAIKVADLGIAHAAGFEVGGIRGTRGYMAPEQLRGGEVDARTDVYALGVTLSQVATGSRTTSSETLDFSGPQTLAQGSETLDLASLDTLEDAATTEQRGSRPVPDWLAEVVERCLAHDPADRWPSMAALAEALAALPVDGQGLGEVLGGTTWGAVEGPVDSLRQEPDAFVGRSADLDALRSALEQPGVIAVLGPPGMGKSRLATRAARHWREAGGAEAWFCDLAEADSEESLVAAVGRTLRIPLGRDVRATVGHALAGRGPLVLILDNFEQLVDHADVVREWAGRAPEARFLVTSRVPLGFGREHRPGPLSQAEAVALLAVRARQRGVEVGDDPSLGELARRLDRLPLALELAAGRLGVLSVRDVLERLDLSLLRAGTDDRHGTLRAALDGSWDLLSERDRAVLAGLSVFAGGFSAEAVEQVLTTPGTFDALHALVDCSLVSPGDGERFRLLASVRAYAREKLADRATCERHHGQWFARLANETLPIGSVYRQRVLREDLANLLAACERAVARGDGPTAVDCFEGAWDVVGLEGSAPAAAELGARVAAMDLPPALGSRAHRLAGLAQRASGQMAASGKSMERALELARASGDREQEGIALHRLGAQLRMTGANPEALEAYLAAAAVLESLGSPSTLSELHSSIGLLHTHRGSLGAAGHHLDLSLEIARRSGNQYNEATALGNQGLLHSYAGDDARAEAAYHAAIAVHRTLGDRRGEGHVLGNLGALVRGRGRLDEAEALYHQALRLHRLVGNRRFEGMVLGNLGNLHTHRGQLDEATTCYRAAMAVHREVRNEHSLAVVLANLGTVLRDRGDTEGAWQTFEEALEVGRRTDHRRLVGWVLSLLGSLAIREGQPARAAVHLDEGEAVLREAGDPVVLSELLAVRVTQHLAQGDRAAAEAVYAELVELAPPSNVDAQDAVNKARAALEA